MTRAAPVAPGLLAHSRRRRHKLSTYGASNQPAFGLSIEEVRLAQIESAAEFFTNRRRWRGIYASGELAFSADQMNMGVRPDRFGEFYAGGNVDG